jgi:quercetin dioxygenase-like cupin family protein
MKIVSKGLGLDAWLMRAAAVTLLSGIAFGARADHGLPHPELLGRGTFVEDVSAQFRVKGHTGGTEVLKISDSSDMVVLRISIEAGGIAPWHTHEGTGLLINLGPGTLTNTVGEDCEAHVYLPGDALVDPGHGDLHAVRNDSDQELVLLAVFLGVETAPVIGGIDGPTECSFLP